MKAMKALLARATRESLGPALLAASLGVVAMFVARYLLLIPTPPELFGDRATVLIPVNLFSALCRLSARTPSISSLPRWSSGQRSSRSSSV